MKFEIVRAPPSKPTEKVVRLQLIVVGEEAVVRAVNDYGKVIEKGNLISLTKDGHFRRKEINPTLGFDRDSQGRIMFSDFP